jgi:hypothetical protein
MFELEHQILNVHGGLSWTHSRAVPSWMKTATSWNGLALPGTLRPERKPKKLCRM